MCLVPPPRGGGGDLRHTHLVESQLLISVLILLPPSFWGARGRKHMHAARLAHRALDLAQSHCPFLHWTDPVSYFSYVFRKSTAESRGAPLVQAVPLLIQLVRVGSREAQDAAAILLADYCKQDEENARLFRKYGELHPGAASLKSGVFDTG